MRGARSLRPLHQIGDHALRALPRQRFNLGLGRRETSTRQQMPRLGGTELRRRGLAEAGQAREQHQA